MRVKCLTAWPKGAEGESLRVRWSRLTADIEGVSVFQSYEWHEAWWKSFGLGLELRLLLVECRGELVAIAPLLICHGSVLGIPRRKLMFIGTPNHSSDYADFIVKRGESEALQPVLKWIKSHSEEWTMIELRNLRQTAAALSAFGARMEFHAASVREAGVAPARLLGDVEEDRKTLNKKSLRRHFNGFQREGKLEFVHHGAESIPAALEPFFNQHVKRWEGTPTPSLFKDPRQREFYRRLAARLAPLGMLHFSTVKFEGKAIAHHFGFVSGHKLVWYKPTFDPDYHRRSPGEVLIRYLLEEAVERGFSEFDMTIGSEPFKFRFSNRVRKIYRIVYFRRLWERIPAAVMEFVKRIALTRSKSADLSVAETRQARSV